MPLIVWNDNLVVGHEEIDGDHRELVRLLGAAVEAWRISIDGAAIDPLMQALIDHTDHGGEALISSL